MSTKATETLPVCTVFASGYEMICPECGEFTGVGTSIKDIPEVWIVRLQNARNRWIKNCKDQDRLFNVLGEIDRVAIRKGINPKELR